MVLLIISPALFHQKIRVGGVQKMPRFSRGVGLLWFYPCSPGSVSELSYAPTSRYRKDTGTIIVGIISAVQARDRFHISRKHTTTKIVRQADRGKFFIKDSEQPNYKHITLAQCFSW